MGSRGIRILGKIDFDEQLLSQELIFLKTVNFSSAYSAYEIGAWKTCILANMSGKHQDDISQEYQGSARITDLGRQVPYIIELVNQTFFWSLIKSIRIFFSGIGGMIIPHKDYLEFKEGFTRIHIPLQIDDQCFNSEEDRVYNMAKGEIWFLDGKNPHSAGNFGKKDKYTIVVDFDPQVEFTELFRNKFIYNPDMEQKKSIQRSALDTRFIEEVLNLHKVIHENNFKNILAHLAKIHFFKHVNCTDTYKWLLEICTRTNSSQLMIKAVETRKFFLGI